MEDNTPMRDALIFIEVFYEGMHMYLLKCY